MTDSLAPVLPEVAPPSAPPAVVASKLTRHYGEGETIVHALRGSPGSTTPTAARSGSARPRSPVSTTKA